MSDLDTIKRLGIALKSFNARLGELGVEWDSLQPAEGIQHVGLSPEEKQTLRLEMLNHFLNGGLIDITHRTDLGALGVGEMWFIRRR